MRSNTHRKRFQGWVDSMYTSECYKLKFGFPDGGRTPPPSACACLRSIVIQQHCMCGHVAYVCPCQFQVMTRRPQQMLRSS